ncbi:hypothetical protein ACPC54_35695 [Kitasatospora sp. NPDC094028]
MPVGCVLALFLGIVLARTGVAGCLGAVPALLVSAGVVLAAAVPVPFGFWLRTGPRGLTVVRAFVPRRYPWHRVRSLAMDTGADPGSGATRLVLHLRLAPRHSGHSGHSECHEGHEHPECHERPECSRAARRPRAVRRPGPVLGVLAITAGGLPRGTEPARLAELLDLLRRHGVPLEDRRYADRVLTAHGYPPLARSAVGGDALSPPARAATARPGAR